MPWKIVREIFNYNVEIYLLNEWHHISLATGEPEHNKIYEKKIANNIFKLNN